MADPEPDKTIPGRSWVSLWAVLIVQAQNAFNDNFVKLALIGLAVTVAAGTAIGDNIEFVLAAMIPLPFVLLAPVAGWFSDRFSKSRVLFLCLIAQFLIFSLIVASLYVRSVQLAIFGYFLLAVQSTMFSPAKQGILKEVIGSQKLGLANGLMQMLTMAGILGGMALGGEWFDAGLKSINAAEGVDPQNAWRAATIPVIAIGLASLLPLVIGLFIIRTPDHPGAEFKKSIFRSHFLDLRYLFSHSVLKRTGLLIAFYWLVANFMGLAFFGFAKELNPDVAKGGVSSSSGRMFIFVGIGLIVGSLTVSYLTRGGNRRNLSIPGGFGMALGLLGMGLLPPESTAWFACVGAMGYASGFFIVPLNAHLQDQIHEDHRGRVLSAQNLLGSLSGIMAIAASSLMKLAGLSVSAQVLIFVPLVFAVSILLNKILNVPAESTE